ncbi:cation:proton antiporter [Candidatus Micrarchaeota archaeon]|nr:cation:proton antiporter [Candidatus Micrarchaeota archaeon]
MVANILITIGAIIVIGFIGRITYNNTKIPEAVIMIFIGLFIGPVLGIVDPKSLLPAVPLVSVLALVLVMLDAGLNLNVFKLFKEFKTALAFTLLVAFFSTLLIGISVHLLFGWEVLHSILLGLIASGTTTVSAMALLNVMKIKDSIKNIIFLETVINDFVLISGASILLLLISGGTLAESNIFPELASNISTAIFLGVVSSYVWIHILKNIRIKRFNYISSIGVLFLLYGITESVAGDGIIAVLIFSLIIGNYPDMHKRFSRKEKHLEINEEKQIVKTIRLIHSNISFAVMIFFFVLIGMVFDISNLNISVVLLLLLSIVLILMSRLLSLRILSLIKKDIKKDTFVLVTMIPRGFVATVLAFIPSTQNIEIPMLKEVILLLVLFTNIFTLGSSFVYSKYFAPKSKRKKR